jgi:hypothetical protein
VWFLVTGKSAPRDTFIFSSPISDRLLSLRLQVKTIYDVAHVRLCTRSTTVFWDTVMGLFVAVFSNISLILVHLYGFIALNMDS